MQLVPVKDISPEWWALYCSAFPPEERRKHSTHEQAMKDANFHVCKLQEGDTFVGLLTWWQWEKLKFIEHFAITAEKRGMGCGHEAMKLLQKADQDDIILEIEPVCDERTARRLAFYQSLGFSELPCAHVQMAYQPGYPDIPLTLLAYSPFPDTAPFDRDKIERFELQYTAGPMRYREMHNEERGLQ